MEYEQLFQKIKSGANVYLNSYDYEYSPYFITPDLADVASCDTVYECRGRGIPAATFFDSSDKVVLHCGHLGYEFNYFDGDGSSMECVHWKKGVDDDYRDNAIKDLLKCGLYLSMKGFNVQIACLEYDCKGRIEFTSYDMEVYDGNIDSMMESIDGARSCYECEPVLFVYNNDDNNIRDFIYGEEE